jgi:hypothetical protein
MTPSGNGFVSKSHDPEGPCVHLPHAPVRPVDLGTTEITSLRPGIACCSIRHRHVSRGDHRHRSFRLPANPARRRTVPAHETDQATGGDEAGGARGLAGPDGARPADRSGQGRLSPPGRDAGASGGSSRPARPGRGDRDDRRGDSSFTRLSLRRAEVLGRAGSDDTPGAARSRPRRALGLPLSRIRSLRSGSHGAALRRPPGSSLSPRPVPVPPSPLMRVAACVRVPACEPGQG